MWRKTIAADRRSGGPALRRLASRLVTGPLAFLVAGLIDVAAVACLLAVRRVRGRSF